MRQAYLAGFALLLSIGALAQSGQTKMETDRPSQSNSSSTVARHRFQAEAGFELMNDKSGTRQFMHPTLLSKYGVAKNLEIRLMTDLTTVEWDGLAGKRHETGLQPIRIGGKVKLLENKGILPQTALIAHISIPKAASEAFREEKWTPDVRLAFQNKIGKGFTLNYNLGADWDDTGKPTILYTINPGYEFAKNWYGFAEYYGQLNDDNHPQHVFDAGFAYYLSPNTRLDLSAGFGISPNTSLKNFVSLGFSFRTP